LQKPSNTPATCVLCKGDHPANYKGCTVYCDLINIRYKNNGNPTSRQNPTIVHTPQVLDEKQNIHRNAVSYAQVAAGISNNNSSINSIKQLSQNMTNFLGEFKKIFSQILNQNSIILNMLSTVINKITK
jgi:hypothetical protein